MKLKTQGGVEFIALPLKVKQVFRLFSILNMVGLYSGTEDNPQAVLQKLANIDEESQKTFENFFLETILTQNKKLEQKDIYDSDQDALDIDFATTMKLIEVYQGEVKKK